MAVVTVVSTVVETVVVTVAMAVKRSDSDNAVAMAVGAVKVEVVTAAAAVITEAQCPITPSRYKSQTTRKLPETTSPTTTSGHYALSMQWRRQELH